MFAHIAARLNDGVSQTDLTDNLSRAQRTTVLDKDELRLGAGDGHASTPLRVGLTDPQNMEDVHRAVAQPAPPCGQNKT